MADDLDSYLGSLPFKMRRELATVVRAGADGLAAAIEVEEPVKSGELRGTVKVRRRRNELDLEVTVGGEGTTKEVRQGSGEDYDYALANEFGTVHQPANPVAYPTARRMEPEIRANIAAGVDRVLK